jgi:hypothetical protein
MADFDPEEITKLMVERANGYASAKTQGKELAEMTGLDPEIAEAFFKGLTTRAAKNPSDIRGYTKTRSAPKKKPRRSGAV